MRYEIYKDGFLENVIVADEEFVRVYCLENGFTYKPQILPGADDPDEPAPVEPTPTAQDDVDAMLIDHEYRLTLLELGLV